MPAAAADQLSFLDPEGVHGTVRRPLYSALAQQASADDRDCQLWSGNGQIVFDQNYSSGLYAASGYTLTIGPGLAIRGLGGDLDPQGGTLINQGTILSDEDEGYRKRINAQLNKGEALYALRGFLFFGDSGTVRRKQEEEQNNQASCLNLLTNAVVTWNTVYMAAVLEQLRADGYRVREEDLVHLSPARYEHINPYGK